MSSKEKEKMRSSDLIVERFVELYGLTPREKSDENRKWMQKNGYIIKQVQKRVSATPWRVDEPHRRKR